MKDIECPYCNFQQDVDHDDGKGYAEDELHQMQCCNCDKYFVFTTSVIYYYEPSKADCLNDSEHKFKPTNTIPREYTSMECVDCGERRKPTSEEMIEILKH